jgi:DNA-directed RNA polymerase specialized sigma24 family protein
MPGGDGAAQLLELHRRLRTGDRTASEAVVRLLHTALTQDISAQVPHTDQHIIWDGVIDAVLDYCARPQQFDAERGVPLERFLRLTSRRNVLNMLRGEQRRKAREEAAGHAWAASGVELDPAAGNLLQKEESMQQQRQQTALTKALQNPNDQQLLALRLQGVWRTEAFAEILGITHLPIEIQRREVKRAKDRIDKTLRRRTGGQHDTLQ